MTKNFSLYIKTVLICALAISILVALFNYIVDPLWIASHKNRLNRYQECFDERQQKTNKLYFGKEEYDTILIGSSRTTYLNQQHFKGMKLFNYSARSMHPIEYKPYLDFFLTKYDRPKNIFLGFDFSASIVPHPLKERPEFYINKTTSFFYRLKILLSLDTLKYSILNCLNRSASATKDLYTRDNIKIIVKGTEQTRQSQLNEQLTIFKEDVFCKGNIYYNHLKSIYFNIKNAHSSSKIIPFTTPISLPMYRLLVEMDRFDDYEKWLRDLVSVFGEIYNFMEINSFTKEFNNYKDAQHFYPEKGDILISKLLGNNVNGYSDFGFKVTRQNIDDYLLTQKKIAESYFDIWDE